MLPNQQCPCPGKDICEEEWQRPQPTSHLSADSSPILGSVNSLGKRDLMSLPYYCPMRLMLRSSCLCFLICGNREIPRHLIVHTSHLRFPDHIQEHTTGNSFPPAQRQTRWLQKTLFASKAAYGILINNRLLDLSPLKSLICLLAELFVPGERYKTMAVFKEPCHLWSRPSEALEEITPEGAGSQQKNHKGWGFVFKSSGYLEIWGAQRGEEAVTRQEKVFALPSAASSRVR